MATKDPYEVLGVKKTATDDEIRKAYRNLAKQHHPDLNPGKASEERFKTVSAAYAILSDPEKRARYDRGEIDASGAETQAHGPYYRDYADAAGRGKYRTESAFSPEDLESIFGAFGERFGGGFGGGGFEGAGVEGHEFSMRGGNVRYMLTVSFLDSVNGAVHRLSLPDGNVLDVTIPAGLKDGQILRLKGKGMPGIGEGPPGDAMIEVHVSPHPFFRREGNDIVLELPVTLQEAVLGGKVRVPTVRGAVHLTIPPDSNTGTRLRLKGRGVPASDKGAGDHGGGDQYVTLKIVLPPEPGPELKEFLEKWKPQHEFDPRAQMSKT